ncbi:hypothetical protein ACFOZ0_24880 [Streptomyces yaanensis]|uniref:Uncharacterized protein n=1 Tax=Streptomyces yaanensis TaxID=1142239 RepID=A0ABV7SJV7_9ACTN|nr:hypothetical protein [Streptomyces sp. CGMCC 4.7035]WNC01430.1 hypothetical protein Q2K21_27085 [Streptomyces sp. CGMCC 4.7035]
MSSSSRTETKKTSTWAGAVRNPWAVVCAVATVVLGPAAATASALDQANRAPMYHAAPHDRAPGHLFAGAGQAQAYLPSDSTRRRVA